MLGMRKRIAVVGVAALILASANIFGQLEQEPLKVKTRFGTLTVRRDRVLLFRGHPFEPSIQGNNNLEVGTPFHIGATDVALVIDHGGTACPYLYHVVTASKTGAKATPTFGTCNSVVNIKRSGDSIRLTMHDYRGPFEPDEERRKAAQQIEIFVFRDGVITHRGKPIK